MDDIMHFLRKTDSNTAIMFFNRVNCRARGIMDVFSFADDISLSYRVFGRYYQILAYVRHRKPGIEKDDGTACS
jgi:hypothetical protein